MSQSQKYWDEYYQKNPFHGGQKPSPFLTSMLGRLQKGKALDVGMGEGINAVYLAGQGFQVKGLDVSQVAVEHAQKLALESQVNLDCKRTDLDLYLFDLMAFDTVIMSFFKPPVKRYYSELIRTLKQGGTLLVESYLVDDMKEIISPDESYRDFYFKPNELLHHLSGLRISFYNEGHVDGHHVVQCLARKPLDKDVAKYNLFDMQTPQQKTEKNTQKELLEALFKKK